MALEIIEFTCTIVIAGLVSHEAVMTTFHIWKGCLIFGALKWKMFLFEWVFWLLINLKSKDTIFSKFMMNFLCNTSDFVKGYFEYCVQPEFVAGSFRILVFIIIIWTLVPYFSVFGKISAIDSWLTISRCIFYL